MVDFALVQLSGGEVCRSNLVRVENFYKFDLVMTSNCHEDERRCSMDIHSVPWQQQMTVNWENVKCDKGLADEMVMETEASTKPSRIHLSAPLMRDLPGARVGIVDISEEPKETKKALIGSDDHDKVHHGLLGSEPHGPKFGSEYTAKALKTKEESWKELKELQSLGSFHRFMVWTECRWSSNVLVFCRYKYRSDHSYRRSKHHTISHRFSF